MVSIIFHIQVYISSYRKLKLLQDNFALRVSIAAKLRHSIEKTDPSLEAVGARQSFSTFLKSLQPVKFLQSMKFLQSHFQVLDGIPTEEEVFRYQA